MGSSKGNKAPKAPDYTALANQQAQNDFQMAQYNTAANRPNQYGPQGSVTWEQQLDPSVQSEIARLQSLADGTTSSHPDAVRAKQSVLDQIRQLQTNNTKWVQNTQFTPEQQKIFDAQQGNQLALQGLGNTAIDQARNVLSSQFNPSLIGFQDPNQARLGGSNVGLPGNTLSQFSNLDENVSRYSDEAQRALYDKATQFMGDRFQQDEDAMRSRLASMGLQEGTQAYQNAYDQFSRNKNDAYNTATYDSILKGYDVGTQNLNNLLNTRGSNIGLQQGVFGQNQSRYGMDLAEREAQANNQMNIANMTAAQRAQQFGEQSYMRSLPLNEIAALLGGSGVQMPQFSGFAPATQSNAADILGAAQAQYNAQMGAYNSQQQGKGNLLGAGAMLGGAYLGGK